MNEKEYLEMRTVTRQLLICLVFGFFICGLHCKILPYPEPAICEYDSDCLKGKAKCIRRECHCIGLYDYGDGKTKCEKWRKCIKEACSFKDFPHSQCLRHPQSSDVTCKCDDGFFGRAYRPSICKRAVIMAHFGVEKRYPCLSDKNCPKFSKCYGEKCSCLKDYHGDGEFCQQGQPVACSDDLEKKPCKDDHAKCIDGRCRCVGMYTGDGKYCRKASPCLENVKCGKNRHCLIDPFLPNQSRCVCNDDAKLTSYGECVDCFRDADCKNNSQTCIKQECTCKDGLAMSDDKTCEPGPLHKCKVKSDCDSRAKCIKGLCFCGESSTGNGKYCRESKPCSAGHQCKENSKCVVDPLMPDKPHCVCSEGFIKTDNGQCVDADEKSKPDSCQPNSVWVNSEGSYECKCKDGYKKNDNGLCQDKDECSENEGMCKAGARCVNFEGGFSCLCKKGYFKKDDECLKDECKVDCEENEECYGGECRCRKSYRKNIEGYCVAVSLKAGSAQFSAYLSTFIFGVLGGLALSA